jgi:hypothetical protein
MLPLSTRDASDKSISYLSIGGIRDINRPQKEILIELGIFLSYLNPGRQIERDLYA